MERKKEKFCVVIAGMHRSGTSVLSRVLNLLGCDLPQHLLGHHPSNETGHWESEPILHLNDEMLESAGLRWEDWSPLMPEWLNSPKAVEFQDIAQKTFREEFSSSALTVFKDPRLCRLLPFWLETLANAHIQPLVILPIRNPQDVAASLAKRDGSEEQYNLLLWLRYVLDAEYGSRNVARCLTAYDDLISDWQAVTANAANVLGIKWPRNSARVHEEIDAFVSPRYRHHHHSQPQLLESPSLSRWIRDTYAILSKWKGTSGDIKDYATLDGIRQELDASAEIFGRLIFRGRVATSDRLKLQQDLSTEKQRVAEMAAAASAREAEIAELHAAVGEKSAYIESLHAQQNEARWQDVANTLSEERQRFEAERQSASTMIDTMKAEQTRLKQIEAQLNDVHLSLGEIRSLSHSLLKEVMPIMGQPYDAGLETLKAEDEGNVAAHLRSTVRLLDFTLHSLSHAARSQKQAEEELLADKAQVIAALQIHTQELDTVLETSQREIEGHMAEIARLEQALFATKSALRQRSAETEDMTREIGGLNHQILYLTQEYETANSAVELMRKTLVNLNDQAERDTQEKEHLRNAYESLHREGQHTIGQLIQLLRAYSARRLPVLWRLTADKKSENIKAAGLIDEAWYSEKYPDIAASGITPARHYALFGIVEGRSPTALIDKLR